MRTTILNKQITIEPKIYILVFRVQNLDSSWTHHTKKTCAYNLEQAINKVKSLQNNKFDFMSLFSSTTISINELKSLFKNV